MRRVIGRRLRAEERSNPGEQAVAERFARGPVVVSAADANRQHYEVPAAFFETVLGPRLKYSSCSWNAAEDLAAAEEEMLKLTGSRASLADGQRILDLGCGWGSFTLWAAEHYPAAHLLAVSNSATQAEFIRSQAARGGLANVEVMTADVADFEAPGTFDRIVSVEMLEHVRNHRTVFERMARWLEPDGSVFVHVFAHTDHAYPYEVRGPADWMAEMFFTGGVMPSRGLLPAQAAPWFELAGQWTVDGTQYERTLNAWLEKLDQHADEAADILRGAGETDVAVALQRWRMFFMACAELFGFRGGREWAVEHYRFTPKA